ncbi:nucleotidyl transferase AbiEii/AbiGii toxin family protein [Pedobacter arcticus]|uniref:nucleotidyl transferase AbiEii/AbiGii toxin family protein n=1 Tax=Pedobacter arcticus TaxID=752140 RepID=UPI0002DD2FAB|nr:nucleotidyl transferase AbiEii/AbiGii toxin family protein [Pedobacter arcticus]
MSTNYLHHHKDFSALLSIIEDETGINANLVEKDYWIMHVLYGLKSQGFDFELKGGTSLSKGYGIIDRFSEDIDIHIKPPVNFGINENPKNNKPNNIEARRKFYDWLAETISFDGIISIERDHAFDDTKYYRSGGIRLHFKSLTDHIEGVKQGILLEAGFDTVTPNTKLTISSWAYDKAKETNSIAIIDNRAIDITCYHPGYTFVEKLQTIATKFRQEQSGEKNRPNFMRQYYDVYCLLGNQKVLNFIGTGEYHAHKTERFPKIDLEIPISENEAFLLHSEVLTNDFKKRYQETSGLYYKGQPNFEDLLARIREHINML